MQTLNLITKEGIKYNIFRFPDGEYQFEFSEELNHKEKIRVVTRITSPHDLFILMQINDILTRHEMRWDLYIPYLMSMRMDRVMDFNRPFSLKIVCNILKQLSYERIEILECHSSVVGRLLDFRYINVAYYMRFDVPIGSAIVYPDKGARLRYNFPSKENIVFDKVRDINTGKLTGFDIAYHHVESSTLADEYTFIDDLCDGGGTFIGELEILKKEYPNAKFNLVVCHAVNPVGLQNVKNAFDKVIVSNSYANWKIEGIEVINVCK